MFNLIKTPYVLTKDDIEWLERVSQIDPTRPLLFSIVKEYFPRWIAYLRSYAQQSLNPDISIYYYFFARLSLHNVEQVQKYNNIPYSVFKFWLEHTSLAYDECSLLYAITGLYEVRTQYILPYCSLQFLFKLTNNRAWLEEYLDLIKDCKLYRDEGFYFNSLNELREYHDYSARQYERELMLKNAARFEYTPTFQFLIESNGYKLPMSVNDFLKLGKQFHTCVAMYQKYQDGTLELGNHCSRVIYDKTTHAEIQIYPYKDHIHGIIMQCKGKYNKNIDAPAGIRRIINGLELLKPEDLHVTRRFEEEVQRMLLENPLPRPRVLSRLPGHLAQNN